MRSASEKRPGAEALSGLARAFFYARTRALLVSHWSVDSAAATRLTTTTFANLKTDTTIGRAEALRRAMLTFLNDASNRRNACATMRVGSTQRFRIKERRRRIFSGGTGVDPRRRDYRRGCDRVLTCTLLSVYISIWKYMIIVATG
jgi:CHAT domain-containing protein